MQLPFRFHRGELESGFFLSKVMSFLNGIVTIPGYIYDELVYQRSVQFELLSEGSGNTPMRENDIKGVGIVAGVFPVILSGGYWTGALFFTESHIVDGVERSERGLYNTAEERFNFVHTESDTYPDDIVTLATPQLKSSVVPTGTTRLGYTRADEDLYDVNGDIIWAHVYETRPVGVATNEFYGPNFSTVSIDASVASPLSIEMFLPLLLSMQKIRYNGPTLATFLSVTQLICGDGLTGILKNMSIAQGPAGSTICYVLTYSINQDSTMLVPIHRLSVWQTIMRMKFKLFYLNEVIA